MKYGRVDKVSSTWSVSTMVMIVIGSCALFAELGVAETGKEGRNW